MYHVLVNVFFFVLKSERSNLLFQLISIVQEVTLNYRKHTTGNKFHTYINNISLFYF